MTDEENSIRKDATADRPRHRTKIMTCDLKSLDLPVGLCVDVIWLLHWHTDDGIRDRSRIAIKWIDSHSNPWLLSYDRLDGVQRVALDAAMDAEQDRVIERWIFENADSIPREPMDTENRS